MEKGDPIPYAGRVFDQDEVEKSVESALDFWLTLGENGKLFEEEFASYLGINSTLLVNSGSSANLIALSCLTSFKLPKERRIKPGDEVITVAAGFPTTVAPLIQVGAVLYLLMRPHLQVILILHYSSKHIHPVSKQLYLRTH